MIEIKIEEEENFMAHEIILNSNFGVCNKVVLEHGHAQSKAELGSCKRDHKIFTVWPYTESLLIVMAESGGGII